MSNVVRVTVRGEWREILTDDDVPHRVLPDAPSDVVACEVACGQPYPFTDDENHNAVGVSDE